MVKIVDVLLPLPIDQLFSYEIGENTEISVGDYVVVPFSKKRLIGIVWKYGMENSRKLKLIEQKINLPSVRPKLIAFAEWVARYNLIPIGMLAKAIMGGVLRVNQIYRSVCAEQKHGVSKKKCRLSIEQQTASDIILKNLNKYSVTLLDGETGSGKTEVYLSVIEHLIGNYNASHTVQNDTQTLPSLCTGTRIQKKKLVSSVQLCKHCNIRALSAEDDIAQTAKHCSKRKLIINEHDKQLLNKGCVPSLDAETALGDIGITSREENVQVLILLPEIVLTSQLVNRIQDQISRSLAQWHSELTPKTRWNNWLNITNGNVQIIIGARSALFLPYKNLKLIIIDEEHDSSFKQEQGIVYNARDMAIVLAKVENIPIILSSATPLLETIYHVKSGNYNYIRLNRRFGSAGLPLIKVIDMRKNRQWISNELFEGIRQAIVKNCQVMLFLNRRGYAQLAVCKKCGYKISCLNCSVWLTYHRKKNILLCHHCSYQLIFPEKCPNCKNGQPLSLYGVGVEKLLEETVKLIPNVKTVVISSDQKSNIIDLVLKEEVNVIIGTQIIAKGHNFPKLTLVGVINADLSLDNPDLRAAEKTYQLLHQVAGRSGRFNEKGTVIVQTNNPESLIIKTLQYQKRNLFYEIELKLRQRAKMPPFSRLIALIICGINQIATQEAASKITSLLYNQCLATVPSVLPFQNMKTELGKQEFEIFGPSPAIINFLNKRYRYRILLKMYNRHCLSMQKKLKSWIRDCNFNSNITVIVDVDPISFF
ncbi:primosomal protein N' [Wolbachia endosymbiont of Cruorifilaria tuberocauda]|uniref:replication restart helicase PriA n=1 Tax=Wolbachia endosymbiont of Cruorifilaria tuberocauda TaxID=1812111 RepID=UPI00158F2C73|nr:primosomal protein N' [Wolbachia endosymbiont of Cruorifilaria tuberocauda]QKX01428.1 primosomal protein N' [Wolbachia endosymbiont of Cruorifilaria tuberocauda]